MTRVLLGTGKKKKIQAVVNFYSGLQKEKKVKILSMKITTKKALFWTYDELKLLYETHDGSRGNAPDKLLNGLDSHAYREQAMVVINCKTPKVEDEMLKVKILTACHAYISKGVRASVTGKELRESQYRVYYQCVIQLKGPVEGVVACKDELIHEKLCDPKSVGYLF